MQIQISGSLAPLYPFFPLLPPNMLSCPPCHHHHYYYSPTLPPRAPRASLLRRRDDEALPPPLPQPPELNPRRHNSKSTALLLRHLSHQSPAPHLSDSLPNPEDLQHRHVSPEERARLLELSLVRRRTPQFPGSIYVQSPGDADVATSLPPIQSLLFRDRGGDDDDEREMIVRAIEIRRKVTAEIFKEAMRKGKFGITYTTNVADRLGEFIDYVMVEAASLKRLPEYSDSTFNVRAKTVIQDSNVVPLIR